MSQEGRENTMPVLVTPRFCKHVYAMDISRYVNSNLISASWRSGEYVYILCIEYRH